MRIIKVSATNSTNSFAKEMYKNSSFKEPICIVAGEQLSGRGQRGATWQSNAGENLTFSIVFPQLKVEVENQFLISAAVAIGVFEALQFFDVKKLKIKWPNDILAANKKIGGILIENFLTNGRINTSIIGVGLNINQKEFNNLPQAASLLNVTGKIFDLDEVLLKLMQKIEQELNKICSGQTQDLILRYHEHLFKFEKPSTFQRPDQSYFVGVIKGVVSTGKLRVQVEGEKIEEFDIKEVKLCY